MVHRIAMPGAEKVIRGHYLGLHSKLLNSQSIIAKESHLSNLKSSKIKRK